MIKYRGYYIDHVVFNNKADIDNYIKDSLIARIKKLTKLMFGSSDAGYMMACSEQISVCERALHNDCGMGWAEIEALEIA